jgi:uncharacterized protein YodC (DUF2158 family)
MPRDSTFKAGDIVHLKSGGPDMTVSDLLDSRVLCQWFHGRLREAIFPQGTLNFSPEKNLVQEAKQMSLRVGDVVQLKSGGHVMTVSLIRDLKAVCQWFDPNEKREKLHEGTFSHGALDLQPAEEQCRELDEIILSAGDVVQLKSGGPKMTVSILDDSKSVCQWFDAESEELHEGTFTHDALMSPAVLQRTEQERLKARKQYECEAWDTEFYSVH